MESITRENLKQIIDNLDNAYLGLVYRILQQFPRISPITATETSPNSSTTQPPNKASFSQRWRGKLNDPSLNPETLENDPRLAYLAERYSL